MREQREKGFFITFEGPEGSGKTLQAKKLRKYLESRNFSVVHTREPGGTNLGKILRKILLNPQGKMCYKTELFLNFADRAEHVQEIIKPALGKGKIVICERFNDATLAYQGYGRGLDHCLVKKIGLFVSEGIKPDLTFLLDIEVNQGLSRAVSIKKDFRKGQGDRLEKEEVSFHQRVREGYLKIAKSETQRIKIILGTGDIEKISQKVIDYVNLMLKQKRVKK